MKMEKSWTIRDMYAMMKQVAQKHNLKINFSVNWERNISFYNGTEIFIGHYGHPEDMFLDFFFCISAIKRADEIPGKVKGFQCNRTSQYQYFFQVLVLALNEAARWGVKFSDTAIEKKIKHLNKIIKNTSGDCVLFREENEFGYYLISNCNDCVDRIKKLEKESESL